MVIATFYDSFGNVYMAKDYYLTKYTLYPGDQSSFGTTVFGWQIPGLTYRLQTDGWREP